MPDARTLFNSPEEATWDLDLTRTPLRHPAPLRASSAFGMYFLDAPLLPVRERELVVLRVARLRRCEFVWGQHPALSRREGIPDLDVERIREGPEAPGWRDSDRDRVRAAGDLHTNARICETTWQRPADHYDERRLLELIFTTSQYGLIRRLANSCETLLDEGFRESSWRT